MPNYKKMYLSLFNDITNIIEQLKQTQIKAEEICTNSEDIELTVLPESNKTERPQNNP